ncbi:MAG: hypothetical protein DMG65_08855 [Candidatus Angelobacter sp. Gp1-AA117]|nr:MAG: hypothetical protein DMG65_08855 [Candidatus Angelobacter sp. Gp1-AA117]
MGWIEDYLHRGQKQDANTTVPTAFAGQARQRWQKLAEELRADVAEFNSQQPGADFAQPSENQFVVSNSISGLQLTLTADFAAQTISYNYSSINDRSAGVPEGGILSIRQSRRRGVEFYSADERLTSEETREVLLKPVLFPPQLVEIFYRKGTPRARR